MAEKTRPLIKICGITRESDARAAVNCGTDAIGINFFAGSPRYVTKEQGAVITRNVGDRVLKVGLFVDADAGFVREVLVRVPLDILQFHGSENQDFCSRFGLPFWKTLRVKEAAGLPEKIAAYPDAAGILLDTWHPTSMGGTGEAFDWSILDGLDMAQKLILAGGLKPDNVRAAINKTRPWAVDVSSGVETSPGIKSAELMQQFIEEVRCA
jgi:phosphoribosylanthranilate isomerase